jgi:hypothetical protein
MIHDERGGVARAALQTINQHVYKDSGRAHRRYAIYLMWLSVDVIVDVMCVVCKAGAVVGLCADP